MNKKQEDRELGQFAESIATEWYVKKGYAILERNWRYGKSEIDIIAQTGDTIIFIEVKARNGKDQDPLEAVTRDKMKRMMRTSDAYIGALTGDFNYRFDIVAFTGGKEDYKLEVYENAFYSPDLY